MKSDSRGALVRPKGTFRVALTPPTEAQLHGTSLRLVRYTQSDEIKSFMKCYASILNNCSNIQSKEHIFSRNIFSEKIALQGFPWCLNEPKEIGIDSAVARILCTTHNKLLINFDSAAGNFFRLMQEFSNHEAKMKARNYSFYEKKRYNINGYLLEKWFVKTLLNILFYQNFEANHNINLEYLLEILYNGKNFENPYGLSIMVAYGSSIGTQDSIFIVPTISQITKEIVGALFKFRGIKFFLKIKPEHPESNSDIIFVDSDQQEWNGLNGLWHPNRINMTIPNTKKIFQTIDFHWKASDSV
ncbi:hypothetical protein [Leptospira levettii]|uniref:hypothetical protein n=1 Tax=Leptospira levettii TaxID=2023178 RepID=UPI0010834365|nr:hypothetical protein [Leptospira levettii]TGK92799.1 hypothetical protein EHQ34_17820 [Leptospira levettii]